MLRACRPPACCAERQARAWKATLAQSLRCRLAPLRRCLLLKFSTVQHDSVLSESRAALLTAAAAAPVRRRMAVLMSLHPRCASRLACPSRAMSSLASRGASCFVTLW